MRVRISYAVDLDDVPAQTASFLKQSADELKDVYKTLDNLAIGLERDELDEAELSQAIDDIRITLSKVDTRLADSKMIMSGFYGATKQLQQVPEESSEEEVFGAD